jgi:hypothetical protein
VLTLDGVSYAFSGVPFTAPIVLGDGSETGGIAQAAVLALGCLGAWFLLLWRQRRRRRPVMTEIVGQDRVRLFLRPHELSARAEP